MTDLFGNIEPEAKPKKTATKPVWSRVPGKRHELCTPCVVNLHENWGTGRAFLPASRAIYIRKEAGGTLYLCENHAAPFRAAESRGRDNDKPAERRGLPGRARPHRGR